MPLKSDMPPVAVAKEHFGHRLLSALWQHSLANPHRPALVNAENEADRVTHRDLYVYSYSVAAFLEERHFGHGNIACLVLPNCWEFVPIFVGVSLRGGAISGASYLFTDYELQQQFLDSKTEVVFCADSTLDRVLKAAKNAPRIKTIVVVEDAKSPNKEYPFGTTSFRRVLEKQPTTAGREPSVNVERDLLLLPYSSGTTGSPKGVMISHTNFGTMMNMVDQHFSSEVLPKIDAGFDWTKEHAQLMLPFYHIYGVGLLCYMLLNGTTGLILKQFNPDIYCKTIEKYKIRIQMLVPPILVFLAKHPIVSKYDLSSLTFILCGAAPAGADLCEEVKKRLPSVKYIAQGYGMTEVSMASHFPVLDKPRYAAAGKLVSNLEMKIMDTETGKEVPKGERGEICIRGPTVMLGYFNRPQATAETIDKEGWLHTGDIGYVDDEDFLYIVDRIKELIKVKGFQVPPAELEDLLLSHPDVRDCAVIGVPDARSGEVPKAFVVKANDRLTEKDVADFVKQRVSTYKQLQGGVEFVAEIPKSAAGKILRRILRDRAAASQPAQCKI